MASDPLDIHYVARLARITLSPEERERLAVQVTGILGYVNKLKEIDLSGVEPTAHATSLINVTRRDEAAPSLPPEEALQNAPSQASGLFMVPKIVE